MSEAMPTHDEQAEERFASLRASLAEARHAATKWEGLAYAADIAMGDAMRDRDRIRDAFARHREAVALFLNELYATMVDPCAEGEMKVADMQQALIQAARDNRQALSDALDRLASLGGGK
jgi:hypothetical protein